MIRASTLRALTAVAQTPQFSTLVADRLRDPLIEEAESAHSTTWAQALAELLSALANAEHAADNIRAGRAAA